MQAVTDAALAHLELDELLAVLLPRIRDILDADTCAVLLLDEDGERARRARRGRDRGGGRAGRAHPGRRAASPAASPRERQPVILDDVDHADVLNPILREKGIKSMLGVPLLVGGEVSGVLHVGTLSHRRFTADDVELLQLVADRVALAIERARLHEETVQLDELKANFVAIASHELRTPATSVYGVARDARRARRRAADGDARGALEVGVEQAERLRRLIEQLLDLSRLDARARAVEPKPLVLQPQLEEIASAALPAGADVEVDVRAEPRRRSPTRSCSTASSRTCSSTRSATAARRSRSRPRRATGSCASRFEDSGEGVPEELRPRLFERFARGDDARRQRARS